VDQEPTPDFRRVQKRAKELGTSFQFRRIDVRDVEQLNIIVEDIANTHGKLDWLIAAAGSLAFSKRHRRSSTR
jgi:NADP-dependent 3-hydroxy acid dehydrogenase YdfG